MGTFNSPEIVREIIERHGARYDDDVPGTDVVRIVQYTTPEGDPKNWGCVYEKEVRMGMLHRYDVEDDYIKSPRLIWTREAGLVGEMPS